jgi:hypothetical protein
LTKESTEPQILNILRFWQSKDKFNLNILRFWESKHNSNLNILRFPQSQDKYAWSTILLWSHCGNPVDWTAHITP